MSNLAEIAWRELQPKFEQLEEYITGSDNHMLEEAGLSGHQLAFKMHVFNWLLEGGYLKKILDTINTILGSLIPGFSIAEPIKEFKDFLELGSKNDLNNWEIESVGDRVNLSYKHT